MRAARGIVFDGYQRLYPLPRTTQPATIVAIDEATLQRYGQWPWPRTRLAELIERIAAARPAAIGLDLFFPEADRFSPSALAEEMPLLPSNLAHALAALPSNDARLGAALHGRRVVLGIALARERDPRFAQPPRAAPVVVGGTVPLALVSSPGYVGNVAEIDAQAAGRGLLDSGVQDATVRTIALVADVEGAIVPTLALEALRVATGEGLRLDARGPGGLEVRFGGMRIPLQRDGRAWVRFGHHDERRFVSASDVLSGSVDPEMLRGKVALVGIVGLGLRDFRTTPLGDFVPGVEVHAQMVENLFDGAWLVRPRGARWAEAAVLLAAALVLVLALPRLATTGGALLVLAILGLFAALGLVAFARWHLLLDAVGPALGTLAAYGALVVGSLAEAESQRRLMREQAARVAGEIGAARRIQLGLLPDPALVVADEPRVRVAALLEPARSVGGDFYDVFRLDARRLAFLVADVSGKGLPAALFMAAVKSQLKSATLRGATLGEALARADAEIAAHNPEQLFVTVFIAALDAATGELEYAAAGHDRPFVARPGAMPDRLTGAGGPPLAVVERFAYASATRTLVPGEWVLLFTDGVTEATNARGEFFGAERLRTALASAAPRADPGALVERVREAVNAFAGAAELPDDLTLVALRWDGPSGR